MDNSQVVDNNNGYLWVVCSFVSFVCSNYALGFFVPKNARKSTHSTWKWKNIANSLLHSCITGLWAMICFWQFPEMKEDLINRYSISAHGVISLSVGYFIYDFLDMGIHDYKRSTDLLVHHCLVILCFGLSVCTCYYQGYSLVALLVEVNSIFLHLRQLMLLHGVEKSSSIYQLNGVFNIATFVVFRVITMGGMFHWLLTHKADLSATVFGLGVFSLIVIMGMNFQLIFRVWKSDYKKRPSTSNQYPSSKSTKEVSEHQSPLIEQVNGEWLTRRHKDIKVPQNGETVTPSQDRDSTIANGFSVRHS